MTFHKSGNNLFITRGDTPPLVFSAKKYPNIDLTNNKFLFIVKKNLNDLDSKILFTVQTSFDTSTRLAKLTLTSTQTSLAPGKYYWGTKLTIGESFVETTAMGEFNIEGGIGDVRPI